jgi:hypothetical protein
MDNEKLNQRLISLGSRATNAHEILRGVTDALAVIGQSAVRAATDDLDAVDDPDVWREEGMSAAQQSETLLREAATLLERTAERLNDAAEKLPDTGETLSESGKAAEE